MFEQKIVMGFGGIASWKETHWKKMGV